MKTTSLKKALFALALTLVISSPANAQIKLAKKIVKAIRVTLADASGSPIAETDLQLQCNGPGGEVSRTQKTDKNGKVTFWVIPQKSNCVIGSNGKELRRFNFSNFEPNTVTLLEMDVRMSNNPKKDLIKNQALRGSVHRLDVYLYKGKKWMKAIGMPIELACLGDSGTIYKEVKKASVWGAKATFENIPYGAECFIRTYKCSKDLQVTGMVSFNEEDHTVFNRVKIHIDIPKKCKPCKGGGMEPDDSDDEEELESSNVVRRSGGRSNGVSVNPNATTNPSSTDPNASNSASDDSDDNAVTEDAVKVAEAKNPYKLIVENKLTGTRLPKQIVTVYEPKSGQVFLAKTNEAGEAELNENLIQPGVEYLVMLGSDDAPVATLNVVSKIQYTAEDRSEVAPFEIASVRHNFPQNGYAIEPGTVIPELDRLAQVMQIYPKLSILVEGYTNSDADATYNRNLSSNRAESIKAYIVRKGIDPSRIKTQFYGETKLITDANGNEDKEASRRVEVKPNWETMLLN